MSARRFVGREVELATLADHLDHVRKSGSGRMLAIRGRRQIGKSRLVEEFTARSNVEAVFYTASRQSTAGELRSFGEQIAASSAAGAAIAAAGPIGSWEAALTIAASDASAAQPIVLVIDELPFLIESEPAIEAIIQKQWDRRLEAQPVLLLLIGSDVSMMAALNDYGRPLYGRLTEMTVGPLSPAAIGDMLDLSPTATLDAYLAIGGFPRLAQIWHRGEDLWRFLHRELQNPESPLIVLGERSLSAEFPAELKARDALEAIGAGERVFTSILRRANMSNKTLEMTLATLIAKRVIDKALAYSAQPRPKLSRYHVADPYLRFWLRFIRAGIPALERGRGDVVYKHIRDSWTSFAGRAIEPLVRSAVQTLLPDERLGGAEFVGSFWNRDGSVEVDLVGGRDHATSPQIDFVGSIKWRQAGEFDRGDLSTLIQHRALVPGATDDTLLVGVSRSGFSVDGLDVRLSPEDILGAFGARP
ncbi:MAG TPA: ATP-binding protein [Solirubrobacteraceae bacterium]|jgi:AAA+ ATPase superfamily predicted ATPase|nr:ATP-binding protein [Solirubrobacteraceae bacterium]